MLLRQVDQIYDFASFFPNDRRKHNGNLIFCMKKNVSLFLDEVVKII